MKPTVGRIVHYYDDQLDINGQGAGPYPAMVLQVFPPGHYINLKVLTWTGEIAAGSVSEKGTQYAQPGRYWVWPPRD